MWQTHSVRWQKKYPWLDARRRGFGCADCAANGGEASQWSTFSVLSAEALRPSGFKNHEDSAEHQGLHRATPPTKQESLDALHAVRKGVTVLPNAGRHKVRRMRFCLAKASGNGTCKPSSSRRPWAYFKTFALPGWQCGSAAVAHVFRGHVVALVSAKLRMAARLACAIRLCSS